MIKKQLSKPMKPTILLGHYEYPPPKLIMLRGVWVVKVSIPAHMRHLFGNGSGTTRDRRKSTKTSDFKVAKSREHNLAKLIYDDFDERIRSHSEFQDKITDKFAIDVIKGLAGSFKYRNIPDLSPNTDFSSLEKLKTACDVYAEMALNDGDKDQAKRMVELLASGLIAESLVEEFKHLTSKSTFTLKQLGFAGRYRTPIVSNFWQDLLISAARLQNLPEPKLDEPISLNLQFGVVAGQILPNVPIVKDLAEKLYRSPMQVIDRPVRVMPARVITISAALPGYLDDMHLKQKNIGTQRKLKRWIEQFQTVMGDLKVNDIKPKHGYDYVRSILKDNPNRSNKTIKDYIWGVQNFLKYCVENGVIDLNPFTGLDLSKYGKAPAETYAFSNKDLRAIFTHCWMPQERLFLSLLATTGMRPSEVGNLTWERFNDTEYDDIRYFTLFDTADEIVQLKNQSSRREVPLHPELYLPPKSSGRLFDYRKDEEGLSATAAGHIINPVIRKLVKHRNKSIRSFRRTFKTLLRDLNVGEEVHDAITGHSSPSASRKNYGGMGIQVKFDAIAKIDLSFLR